MGKFDGVLLATDFDDTFCPASVVVPQVNLDAVEYFKSQGGLFTIATGRAHRTFAPQLHQAPVNAPVVLSNGGQIYDFARDELVLDKPLPNTILDDLQEVMAVCPQVGIEGYYGDQVYVWNSNHWIDYHLKKARTEAILCPVAEMPLPWSKAILENDNEILLPAQAYIRKKWPDRYEAIFSNFHMLEITAKGATKGGTVLELAQRLGIRRENIYCVGDNQNDLPMLEISAVPFAPANCAQEVKDWGAELLPPCEEGAIAALIHILDTRY